MIFPCISLDNCLEVVPPATREWNPETAPQATKTNNIGQTGPCLSDIALLHAGVFSSGPTHSNPRIARAMEPKRIYVER